jgi:hypothetical protein
LLQLLRSDTGARLPAAGSGAVAAGMAASGSENSRWGVQMSGGLVWASKTGAVIDHKQYWE